MENSSKRTRHNKTSKVNRKSRAAPSNSSIPDRFSRVSGSSPRRSAVRSDPKRLDDLIDNLTSEADDASVIHQTNVRTRSSNNLVDPDSPPINANRVPFFMLPTANSSTSRNSKPSKNKRKPSRSTKEQDYSSTNREKEGEIMNRRKSVGDERRHQLTECMEYYRACLETAQQFHSIYKNDETSKEQRKQYATALWYELKTFFRGVHTVDESGVKMEQINLEQQRRRQLDEFYNEFMKCDFENSQSTIQTNENESKTIERRQLSENHLNSCSDVEKSIRDLFSKWDQILSLFPSHAALAQYDKRFDPTTKEGRMFYEKLSVFQAWFNLNSEINRLIGILGLIMGCSQCQAWPNVSCSTNYRSNENASRPPTPSSTSSTLDFKEMNVGSPSNASTFLAQPILKQQNSTISNSSRLSTSSSFSTTPETNIRRLTHITSMTSIDLNSTTISTQPLTEFYYRYIDDQLTHARIELIASIFRSKHGPLLQRLRYVLRKDQTTMSNTSTNNLQTSFDTVFKYYPVISSNTLPLDIPMDRQPDGLMEEFLLLNKQLQQLKNPKLMNKIKKNRNGSNVDQVTNILGRFDQNPTLTSSTFAPASAPTLVLRILSHDRTVLKRQSYFLDYLDATLFPHLPGSTLFPDPCTFLDKLTFTSYSQTSNDEMSIINKMLTICYRLYDKHVWTETGKCSDMFELFHLPSLYPQYVFLVQIPLDLMFAWYKYHQYRKMDQTSTTGALLLLIDECKVLIHSSTLIRQYIKIMMVDVFEKSQTNLIEKDLIQFDANIIATIDDVLKYIEDYVKISLRSNLFHNAILLLRDQWKSLKRYATAMNVEETLADRFLNLFAKVIENYREYLDVFHATNTPCETNKADYIKKKIQKKYQKKVAMDILREAKAVYEDCAVTTNIYLQKPVCRRFLLILKTAGFERIKFGKTTMLFFSSCRSFVRLEDPHPTTTKTPKETSTCLLFAPAEYFENNATKLQLARTLSSSFRINTTLTTNSESTDDPQQPQQNSSPPPPQQTSSDAIPPSVYVLCVPIASELESEWRGVTHTISTSKSLNLSLPLFTSWKTTTIFLLSQSINLDKFEESFRERLSKTNVQQNDLYNFDKKSGQTLQKRSCFEKVDEAMHKVAHAILALSHQVVHNVENFELLIDQLENRIKSTNNVEQNQKIDIRHYVVSLFFPSAQSPDKLISTVDKIDLFHMINRTSFLINFLV